MQGGASGRACDTIHAMPHAVDSGELLGTFHKNPGLSMCNCRSIAFKAPWSAANHKLQQGDISLGGRSRRPRKGANTVMVDKGNDSSWIW